MDLSQAMEKLKQEQQELEQALAEPDATADGVRYRDLSMRYSELQPRVALYDDYLRVQSELADAEALLAETREEEMREFLTQEVEEARQRIADLEQRMLVALIPPDPMAEKKAIMEIRAGTGGEEAALFARDLFEMYARYAERKGWRVEVIHESPSEREGYKEIIFEMKGRGAFGALELESGVHRVQRVPQTETQGRIHTSAATVAVLPEIEAVDMEINPGDLSVEAFRAGGPGGQHMQKNETAVRITHLPTGLSVACSSERSQLQNRERAMTLLRARLYEMRRQEQMEERSAQRREQIKSGDRSEKIRTYNFPQDRLTDHRAGLTLHNLPALLVGELDDLIAAMEEYKEQQRLEELAGDEA